MQNRKLACICSFIFHGPILFFFLVTVFLIVLKVRGEHRQDNPFLNVQTLHGLPSSSAGHPKIETFLQKSGV